jgi:hypothetical protein
VLSEAMELMAKARIKLAEACAWFDTKNLIGGKQERKERSANTELGRLVVILNGSGSIK